MLLGGAKGDFVHGGKFEHHAPNVSSPPNFQFYYPGRGSSRLSSLSSFAL